MPESRVLAIGARQVKAGRNEDRGWAFRAKSLTTLTSRALWATPVVMRLPLMYIPRTDPSEQASEGVRMFYEV